MSPPFKPDPDKTVLEQLKEKHFRGHEPATFYTARALAAYAGVSPQVVRSRLDSGDLRAAAMLSTGDLLFYSTQAYILKPKNS